MFQRFGAKIPNSATQVDEKENWTFQIAHKDQVYDIREYSGNLFEKIRQKIKW